MLKQQIRQLLLGAIFVVSTPFAVLANGPLSDSDLNHWVEAHGQQWLQDHYPGENPQAEAQKAVSRYRQCESQGYSGLPVSSNKLDRYNSHDDPWFQKWALIKEYLDSCQLPPADAGDEINNRNQNSSSNVNNNDVSANGGDADANAAAEAYLQANPSASVGEVSNYLEQQLDLSNDNAVEVATQAKQRQQQNQSQTQTQGDDSSTAVNRNGDVINRNEYNNRDVEFGSLDTVQPGASAPAGQCTADLTVGQVRSVVSAPVKSDGGNGFGIQGGIDDSDSETAVQAGLTFGSGQDTEGLTAKDCKRILEPAMEVQRNVGGMLEGATLDSILIQPNRQQNVNVLQNSNKGGEPSVPPLEFDN